MSNNNNNNNNTNNSLNNNNGNTLEYSQQSKPNNNTHITHSHKNELSCVLFSKIILVIILIVLVIFVISIITSNSMPSIYVVEKKITLQNANTKSYDATDSSNPDGNTSLLELSSESAAAASSSSTTTQPQQTTNVEQIQSLLDTRNSTDHDEPLTSPTPKRQSYRSKRSLNDSKSLLMDQKYPSTGD